MTVPTAALTALAPVLGAYRTCELATVTTGGTPVAWPAVTVLRGDGTFVLTTSVALPRKALNLRRDPRVGLLFSDPTASGLVEPPQVLVQGTATVSEGVVASPAGLEDYWRRLYERQPVSRGHSRLPLRLLMDWYYWRLVLTVTPRTTTVLDRPLPGPRPLPTGGDDAFGRVARRLPEFGSAVLTTLEDDGTPRLERVHPVLDTERRRVVVRPSVSLPGPASLLAHRHDEQLWQLRSFVATGLVDDEGVLDPQRFVPGAEPVGPLRAVGQLRELRTAAQDYLEAHHLPRPVVPWPAYRELARPLGR